MQITYATQMTLHKQYLENSITDTLRNKRNTPSNN